jgi:iron complex outermembrane receptor protein
MESTGGMADGNTYVGNVDLNPELVHEIELGLD